MLEKSGSRFRPATNSRTTGGVGSILFCPCSFAPGLWLYLLDAIRALL